MVLGYKEETLVTVEILMIQCLFVSHVFMF